MYAQILSARCSINVEIKMLRSEATHLQIILFVRPSVIKGSAYRSSVRLVRLLLFCIIIINNKLLLLIIIELSLLLGMP